MDSKNKERPGDGMNDQVMTATEQPQTMTEGAWRALGAERFGPDTKDWRFRCPTCGHEITGREVKARFPDDVKAGRLGGYRIEQECIGRYVDSVDCNWCAYGLFRGPNFVECSDGTSIPVFPFAREALEGGS